MVRFYQLMEASIWEVGNFDVFILGFVYMRTNSVENASCLRIFMGVRVGEGWLLERLPGIRDVTFLGGSRQKFLTSRNPRNLCNAA